MERYMREHGFRWTIQRRLIAQAAFSTHEHFSADELHDMCRGLDDSVSRATVYRTLSMLEEAGFIGSLDMGEGVKRFEHVLGHAHHDHMVCQDCGRIIEFHDEQLERMKEAIARERGFQLVSHELTLTVSCEDPDCVHRKKATEA